MVAVSTAIALGASLLALRPPDPPSVPAVVVSHDLPAGAVLRLRDLHVLRLPPDAAPAGAASRREMLTGRTLAAGMRAREVVTDARLVGRSLTGGGGQVLSVLRVADAAARSVVRVGDRVDVLAASDERDEPAVAGRPAAVVATGVRVVALPTDRATSGAGAGSVLIVVTDLAQARALAGAGTGARLSVVVLG